MAKLSFSERNNLEKLFQMGGGWVLDFTNRTITLFVADACQKNFDDTIYDEGSNSKAKRLRKFWEVESDRAVGLVVDAMAQHAATLPNTDQTLVKVLRTTTRFSTRTKASLSSITSAHSSDFYSRSIHFRRARNSWSKIFACQCWRPKSSRLRHANLATWR